MATTPPPTNTTITETPPVQVLEDPASLALRAKTSAAQDKQAAAVDRQAAAAEAMNETQRTLVQALSAQAAPATDAQLWLLLFQVALHGLLRHPSFANPVAGAEAMASEALAAYRRKFPLAPAAAG